MGAKINSKTHLLNKFLDFLISFLRVWLPSFQKVLIWPNKFLYIYKRYKKTQNFTLISNPLKKFEKNASKKFISKRTDSKSA